MAYSHPNCTRDPAECRITVVSSTVTAIDWAPVYDGHGVMTNRDPNTSTTVKSCSTCSAEWSEVQSAGELIYATTKDPVQP